MRPFPNAWNEALVFMSDPQTKRLPNQEFNDFICTYLKMLFTSTISIYDAVSGHVDNQYLAIHTVLCTTSTGYIYGLGSP